MYNKYTLRNHIKSLEEYIKLINNYNIDYYKYSTIINNLNSRIYKIKDFLNIDYEIPKRNLNYILKNNIRFLKKKK